jgi:hypothetical protein
MKIDSPGSVRANSVRRTEKSRNGQGSAFAKHISSGTEVTPVAGGGGAAQLGSVEALVALQEVPDASRQTKPPEQKHAEDLLDRLDQIRMGLLRGNLSPIDLQALVLRMAERRRDTGDPRLLAIVDEIELRAKVELAKLSMM